MDQRDMYRKTIVTLLRDMAEAITTDAQVETIIITDYEHDHYQLVFLGWEGEERIFDTAVYIRIRDSKIWIEQNTTPDRIGEQLLAAGISPKQIVLGFQPQELRHLTDFAVA
jgi:hypothetical protein